MIYCYNSLIDAQGGIDTMSAFIEEFISYLNLIHRLSVSENAQKTQNMVQCIDRHIRYKYLRVNEIVKLRTEMLQVDNLINIFRTRFGDNLEYGKSTMDRLPDPYLPANTVLALVESALIHGLTSKEGDWRLNIDIDRNEHGLLIHITDNGIGPASTVTFSSAGSERKEVIAAVNLRLKDYFSNPVSGSVFESQYGNTEPVNISSSGKCNKVTIHLPHSGL